MVGRGTDVNRVMLLNIKTGEDLCNNMSLKNKFLPISVCYIEEKGVIMVASINLQPKKVRNTDDSGSQLHIFNLIDNEGVIGLNLFKVQKFSRSRHIKDVKSFNFFDGKTYVAIAFNNLIQIYHLDMEDVTDDLLQPKFKIDYHIDIYKVKIRKIDEV
jgi:hypothetical protein